MSKGKQTTLFQSWGGKIDNRSKQDHQANVPSTSLEYEDNHDAVIDLCSSFDDDEEDDILLHAEDNLTNHGNTSNGVQQLDKDPDMQDHVCDVSVGVDECIPTQKQSSANVLPGFDRCAGKLWIYPTNYPVRDYQFSIVQQSLYKNTMVTLPTGLGKTFIAAVVMYNFYRWYPQGKVVFMAPTKPLVAQQIEACYNIMGIPQEHTAEMTGTMGPQKRETAWHDKRVFFLTPQVLTNDLSRGSCPGVEIKCLVIDEAHKALGNHAYCQVVRELVKYTENFRVLALSATPGSDIKSVQLVLSNLLISHIEIRTEESADIKHYSHERKVEKIVVPLGEELTKVKTKYIQIMDTVVKRLKQFGVLYHKDTTSLSKFLVLKAREGFRQNPPERLQRSQYGIVEGDFAMAMSLYHGYELLQLHGSRSLHNFLQNILTGEKAYGRTRSELTKNADFNDLMNLLSEKYKMRTDIDRDPCSISTEETEMKPFLVGHPKMEKLQDIILKHFKQSKDGVTRVMIFSQYRDSVQEITDMLHCHEPMIKVMSFIGQASTGKTTKGFTQKEQLKVMKQFREGGYNTLVSTCVGEEGLDIGDVDLIICFDAHKSPIRLVQRMGRTGRKREGKIVMLVTEGKEEQIYNQSQYSKRSIHKAILNGARSLHFYQHSPRMIPEDLTPATHKMYITVKESFKTDKKLASTSTSDHKKITQAMKDSTHSMTEEVLTLEEYRELKPWLVPEDQIPKLAPASVVCLPPKQEIAPTGILLSLSEWSPWQTTLQETGKIDHSMDTKHLVELMEFIQLQQSLDPGDDPYGLEMAAYLNEDDILKPGESETGKGTILKFCQPAAAHTTAISNNTKSRKKQMTISKKQRIRRSDALPTFDGQDNRNNSSDDDLPAFDLEKKSRVPSGDITHSEHKYNDTNDKSIGNSKDSDNYDTRLMNTLQQEKKPCKVESKARLLDKRMNEERKRRKRRHTSNQSVIDVIADTDCNDFDNDLDIGLKDHSISELPSMFSFNNVLKQTPKTVNGFENMGKSPVCKREIIERCHVIGTPPSLDEVSKIVQATENKELLSIDLLKLLEEWNRENVNGKFIDIPLNGDLSSDTYSSSEELMVSVIGIETDDLKTDCKNSMKLVDSTSIRKCDSKFSIDDSDTDFVKPCLLKIEGDKITEGDTKIEMNLKNKKTNGNLKSPVVNIRNFGEKIDHDCKSLTTPKAQQSKSDDELSTASEDSPVFHRSQRRNTSHSEPQDMMINVDAEQEPDSPSELWTGCSIDESLLFKAVKTPHDMHTPNTQVTFTQAFACIHSGSLESGSDDLGTPDQAHSAYHKTETKKLKQNSNERSRNGTSENELLENLNSSKDKQDISKYSSSTDVSHNMDNSGHNLEASTEKKLSDSADVFEDKDMLKRKDIDRSEPEKLSDSRKPSSSSEDGVEFPDFDLGFDIDDDIIPPSPQASQPCVSKVSRLSQAFRGNITQKNVCQKASDNVIEETEEDLNTNIADLSEIPSRRKNLFSSFKNHERVKSETYIDFDCNFSRDESVSEQNQENHCNKHGDVQNYSKGSSNPNDANEESKDSKNETESSDSKTNSHRMEVDVEENVSTNPVNDAGTPDGSEGFQCNSPMFETSFALLDEDLDDWIDSGMHLSPRIKNCDIEKVKECTSSKTDICPDENSESVIEACDINNKVTDISVNEKGIPADWFDDSFSCPNSVTSAKNTCTPKLKTTDWLTSKNSTSTPLIDPRRKVQTVTPFRSFSETINTPGEVNNDDSFIVRRKKKVRIIDSPESEIERSPKAGHVNDRKSEHLKTLKPTQDKVKKQRFTELLSSSSENDDNFDDSVMLTKNKYMVQKPSELSLEKEDTFSDSDFEESFVGRQQKQEDRRICKSSNINKSDRRNSKSIKPKRPSNPFLDEEADLSEEHCDNASSDEAEGSDLDQYDDSFIHDSQFSQSQAVNQSDMQALYLKSVKSPVGHRGGYKLQFNPKNTSVYSQAPPEVESQYMEDSFCVGSEGSDDEFDWLSISKDASHSEVTILHADASTLHGRRPRRRNVKTFQTSRQRAIHDGRMKALDKIRAKAVNKHSKHSKSTNLVQIKEKENTLLPMTNRIKLLHESSSEDDDCIRLKKSVIISPEAAPVEENKKKRPLILSSSDDDDGSFDNMEQSGFDCFGKHIDQTSGFQVITGGPETDTNLPLSLKERIKLNSAKRKRTEESKDISENSFSNLISTEKQIESVNEDVDVMTKIKSKIYDRKEILSKTKGMRNNDGSIDLTVENNPDLITSAGVTPVDVIGSGSFSSKPSGKAIILVDSKELSGAQDIISDLRFKHNIQVSTASNLGCDFIVSNRMAVERKQWSEFSNGANRTKLIERLQQLQTCYDRSCLVVEKDRVKPGEEKPKNVHWTKYVHRTCAMLLQSQVKLLFSETQGETAVLLADLCNVEQRKNMAITGKVDLTPDKTNMIKFYTSLPNVTYVNALNLCNMFASVKEFMSSSVATIEERGKMSKARATDVYNFIRRDFDQHMLPTKYS